MSSLRSALYGSFLSLGLSVVAASGAVAGIHTWDVNEVFSNADGSIQYVELWEAAGSAGEVNVGNGTISSNTQNFSFGQGAVAAPTTNKFYLVATQGFADLPGAPVPDAIIPAGKVPFFATTGDTVAFGSWDSWAFGAVSTNGTDALNRSGGTVVNSPTNYAGVTGSVNATPPPCYSGTPGASSCSALAGCGGSTCDDADSSTYADECTEASTTCSGLACYSGTPGASSCAADAGCGGSVCDDGDASTDTDVCVEGITTCAGTTSVPSLSNPALGVVAAMLLATALLWALPRWLRSKSYTK